jgi:hypothetical protein
MAPTVRPACVCLVGRNHVALSRLAIGSFAIVADKRLRVDLRQPARPCADCRRTGSDGGGMARNNRQRGRAYGRP